MRTAVWLLLLGCSGDPAPARSTTPAAPASKCAHVADHLISLLSPTAQEAPVEEIDRVRIQFKARCEDDGWSLPAQECFLGLATREDVDRCAAQLTEAQLQALEAAPATSGADPATAPQGAPASDPSPQ